MTLVFVIVFLILWKFGFPAIVKMIDERKAYIDESLRKAKEANDKLQNIQKEGEAMLQEARDKQAAILREAASTRDAIVEKAQAKANDEGARILAEAKAEIDSQKQAAIRAEKILREKLAASDKQNALIDKLLDEVSSDNNKDQ